MITSHHHGNNGHSVQYKAASAYVESGQSVLPIGLNRRPGRDLPMVLDENTGEYRQSWTPLQERYPTDQEMRCWFTGSDPCGIGIINGKISGNRETIDFDTRADEILPAWCELVSEEAPDLIAKLSVVKSPGGYHVAYRCEEPVPGNDKLAMPANPKEKPLIETRGEGGYVVAPGSPEKCHPSGKTYEHHSGPRVSQIQTISAAEREILIRCARSFDESPKVERANGARVDDLRPGDDFNRRGDWREILEPAGWANVRQRGDVIYWRRDGKADDGWSATTGKCTSKAGNPLLCVYSTAAHPFEHGESYSKFSAYALLHHRGDFQAAAKALADKGYGDQSPRAKTGKPEQQQEKESKPEPWQPPIPLEAIGDLPEFPVDCLPPPIARFCREEAIATQTPVDLVAMLVLGAGGAGLAKKLKVHIRDSWFEHVNIFVVAALPPGERKSTVFNHVKDPVMKAEAEEIEACRDLIAEAESELRIMQSTLKAKEGQAAKEEDPEELKTLLGDCKELAKCIANFIVPAKPQYVVDDCTPEALAKMLTEQGGRLFQASAEGTAFEIAKGRYSDTANLDVYLKGHANDALRTNRIGREREIEDEPALSVALAVQPDCIEGLNDDPSMRGRGFLARFLYAIPTSKVGTRMIAAPPVSKEAAAQYESIMLSLWKLDWNKDQDGNRKPYILAFSGEADAALREFETWLEPQLLPGGELAELAGWANKLAGAVARLSGIVHMLDCASDLGQGWMYPIGEDIVLRIIALAKEYLIPHAKAAFQMMVGSAARCDAIRVIDRLKTDLCELCVSVNGVPLFSKRDLHAKVFGGNRRKSEEVDRCLDLLEDHLYIRAIDMGKTSRRGRKPSQKYEVNPLI